MIKRLARFIGISLSLGATLALSLFSAGGVGEFSPAYAMDIEGNRTDQHRNEARGSPQTAGAFTSDSNDPGENTRYSITFTATADYTAGVDNLIIELEDFGFPSGISPSSIAIFPSAGQSVNPQAVAVVGHEELHLTLPDFDPATESVDAEADKIDADELITVVIHQSAGITNPTEGGNYPAVISGPGEDIATERLTIYRIVKLSDGEGVRGDVVTATGKGFKNGTTLTFWVDGNLDGKVDSGEDVLCSANVAGDDTASCDFLVAYPTFEPGDNYVNAVDGRGNTADSTTSSGQKFILQPSLTISPIEAAPGDSVEVRLLDFPAGSLTTVLMSNFALAEPSGGWPAVPNTGHLSFSITVPANAAAGLQELLVTASGQSATANITVATPTAPATPMPTPTVTPIPALTPAPGTPTPAPGTPTPTAPPQLASGNEPPHVFTGTATLDGKAAAAGTAITAYDGNKLIGATTAQTGGRFGIHTNRAGGAITFQVDNQPANESWPAWTFGGITTGFNLTAVTGADVVNTPADLFRQLPELVRAFSFDNFTKQWAFYDPQAGDANNLIRFVANESYWILVSHNTRLWLNGLQRNLTCVNGNCWNLIVW